MRAPRQDREASTGAAVGVVLGLLGAAGLGVTMWSRSRLRDGTKPSGVSGLGYETTDAPAGLAVGLILGLLALVGVGTLVALGVMSAFDGDHQATPLTGFERVASVPAEPRLEIDPRRARRSLEQAAQAHLAGYGWSDRAAGLARIPIERAMVLQVQRGWPDADAPDVGTPVAGRSSPPGPREDERIQADNEAGDGS